jgi:hypothetical protein
MVQRRCIILRTSSHPSPSSRERLRIWILLIWVWRRGIRDWMNDGVPLWLIRACWKILDADDIFISCDILGGLHISVHGSGLLCGYIFVYLCVTSMPIWFANYDPKFTGKCSTRRQITTFTARKLISEVEIAKQYPRR